MSAQQRAALPELARVFLRLGSTAFGGPAAHTALLHQELVVQRQSLSEEQFLDLVSAANLIPGPNSTELVIHIGLQRAGYAGMLVAGLCFIAPAMFSVLALAAAYVRFGSLPAALALLAGVNEVGLLLPAVAAASALPFALPVLFLVFLKIGAVLYGSGYVLLAFLRADLVVRLGWITERQLLDAVAAGQLTPGPLFTSATFIGYLLGGLPGALLATLGIFLPAFIFVPHTQPLLARQRSNQSAAGLLAGVNAASLGLLAAVAGQLAWGLAGDPAGALLGVAALLLLLRTRIPASWLLLGGALLGVLRGALLLAVAPGLAALRPPAFGRGTTN